MARRAKTLTSTLPTGVRRLASGRYQARYPYSVDPLRRPLEILFETPEEAAAGLVVAVREVNSGERVLLMPGDVLPSATSTSATAAATETASDGLPRRTVKQVCDDFLAEHNALAVETRKGYRSAMNSVILHETRGIAGLIASDLTPGVLRQWKNGLRAAGVTESMETLAWKTLSSAMSWEVDMGRLEKSPAVQPTTRRTKQAVAERYSEEDDLRLPTWEEVSKMAMAIPGHQERLMFLILAFSGPRASELFGIEPTHLRPENHEIHLSQVWVKPAGGAWVKEPLKSGLRRPIHVPEGLWKPLEAHLGLWTPPKANLHVPALFVPSGVSQREGIGVWTRNNWRDKVMVPATTAYGLDYRTKDLRAYAASALMDAGATILEAKVLLGHAKSDTTEKHYARARDARDHDSARMRLRLRQNLSYVQRLDRLYDAFVKTFGDPFAASCGAG